MRSGGTRPSSACSYVSGTRPRLRAHAISSTRSLAGVYRYPPGSRRASGPTIRNGVSRISGHRLTVVTLRPEVAQLCEGGGVEGPAR